MNELSKMTAMRKSTEVMEFVYDFFRKEALCYLSDYNAVMECKICIKDDLIDEYNKIHKYVTKIAGAWGKIEGSHREDLKCRYIEINFKIIEEDRQEIKGEE